MGAVYCEEGWGVPHPVGSVGTFVGTQLWMVIACQRLVDVERSGETGWAGRAHGGTRGRMSVACAPYKLPPFFVCVCLTVFPCVCRCYCVLCVCVCVNPPRTTNQTQTDVTDIHGTAASLGVLNTRWSTLDTDAPKTRGRRITIIIVIASSRIVLPLASSGLNQRHSYHCPVRLVQTGKDETNRPHFVF